MFHVNFGGFGFDPFAEMQEMVIIEIQLGNQVVERNQMPVPFAKQQFAQIVKQIANEKRPMAARAILQGDDGKNNILEFKNNAFVGENVK